MGLVVSAKKFYETLNEEEKKQLADVIMENMTPEDKNTLYHKLWYERVCEDVQNHSQALDKALNKDGIESIADRYVYKKEYNNDLPYWDNIENLIDEAYENEDYRWNEEDLEDELELN